MLRSPTVFVGAIAWFALVLTACRETREYPLNLPVSEPGDPGVDPDNGGGGRRGAGGAKGTGGAKAAGGSSGASNGGAPGGAGMPDAALDVAPTSDTGTPAPDAASAETGPPPAARSYALQDVALWRGNATAAYTILHEVVCDSAFLGPLTKAQPELQKRGLTAAFAVIANLCTTGNHWPKLKALAEAGNEILNQGFSHACLGPSAAACGMGVTRSTDYAKEIGNAATELKNRLGLTDPGVFVFPYDSCSPAATTYLKNNGYLGARCGTATMNASSFADAYAFKFDLWGPATSGYGSAAACRGVTATTAPTAASAACRAHVLNAPLDEAIKQKGWFIRGFHGFQGDMGTYQPVAIADYTSHLDMVAAKVKEGTLWVAGPNQVVRYRFARQLCPRPTLAGATLSFPAPAADCAKYATRLSYVVTSADGADPATIAVTQAGTKVAGRKLGPGTFVIEADPTKGDATLSD